MTRIIFITAFITMFSIITQAQNSIQRQKHFHTDKQHLALGGYDPVSYFNGKPLKGKKEFSLTNEGVTYHFNNATNRDAFKANPQKYEPAYGGWCAYAMALKGEKVEVDPLTYKISNGRLLLFYNKFFTNTLDNWNQQKTPESELLKKGDTLWAKMIER